MIFGGGLLCNIILDNMLYCKVVDLLKTFVNINCKTTLYESLDFFLLFIYLLNFQK